jgi:hypothetical protein
LCSFRRIKNNGEKERIRIDRRNIGVRKNNTKNNIACAYPGESKTMKKDEVRKIQNICCDEQPI